MPPWLHGEPREETDLLPGECHAGSETDSNTRGSTFDGDLWRAITHLTELLERHCSCRNAVLIVRYKILLYDYSVWRNQIFNRVRHPIRSQFRRHIEIENPKRPDDLASYV